MKVTEYRRVLEALSRFASTRPKAEKPESVIGVQVNAEGLKLVAGTDTAGIIYNISDEDWAGDRQKYSFIIDARPLLESGKVLPTKDTVTFDVMNGSFAVVASGGGRLALNSVGMLRDGAFPRKPKSKKVISNIYAEQWGQMARIISDIADKSERPTLRYSEGKSYITIVSPGLRARYSNLTVDAHGEEFSCITELPFWDGLRSLTDNGLLVFGEDGVVAVTPKIECFSTIISTDERFFWPVLMYEGGGNSLTIGRNDFISALRAQAPNDEHHRITLSLLSNGVLVTPFGGETGLTIPCKTEGTGFRSMNADYLRDFLSDLTDAKQVTLTWANPAPAIRLSAKEYAPWTLMIAPVALS